LVKDSLWAASENAATKGLEISKFQFADYIPSFGSAIATLLTTGSMAYLALAAFLYVLLKFELKRRIVVMQLLLHELRKTQKLVLLMLNSPALSDASTSRMLEFAYAYIRQAYIDVGEARNQMTNLGYYFTSKLDSADNQLENAKKAMETPVADALIKMIEDARLFEPDVEEYAEKLKNPPST
jgi:hypothetical protein